MPAWRKTMASPTHLLCGIKKIQSEEAMSGVYAGASAGDKRQRALMHGSSALGEAVQRMKVPSPCQHSAVIGSLDGVQSPLKSQRALLYGTVN